MDSAEAPTPAFGHPFPREGELASTAAARSGQEKFIQDPTICAIHLVSFRLSMHAKVELFYHHFGWYYAIHKDKTSKYMKDHSPLMVDNYSVSFHSWHQVLGGRFLQIVQVTCTQQESQSRFP